VEIARTAGIGRSMRYSSTVKQNMLYLALRTSDTEPVAFVRVARPVSEVQAQAGQLRNLVWGMAGGTAVFALLLTGWLTPLSDITACVETLVDGGIDDLEHRDRFLDRIL
jgi:two-component system phosphate regulon sensor histidine kinase PhoR